MRRFTSAIVVMTAFGFLAVLPMAARAGTVSAILADNPVAFWPLSDASGSGTAANVASTGGALNGTAHNVTFGGAGPLGQQTAGSFNGSSTGNVSYIGLPAGNPNLEITSAFTLEAWVNLSSSPNALNTIYAQPRSADGTGIAFSVNGSDQLGLYMNDTATNISYFSPTATVTSGQWDMVAATYDGSTNTINLYVNGILEGSDTISPLNLSNIYAAGIAPSIGREFSSPDFRSYDGSLADVAVFNTALTSAQIQLEYAASAVPEPSSLVSLCTAVVAVSGIL